MKFHSLTKMLTVGLIAVMTAALLVGCGSESSQKKFLNIATGGTAGTYYPIGGAMAEILNKEIPGMNASAQSTGATVANINMLKDNSVDLAIVQNDITYYAVNGTEMFQDKKVDNIRGIALSGDVPVRHARQVGHQEHQGAQGQARSRRCSRIRC